MQSATHYVCNLKVIIKRKMQNLSLEKNWQNGLRYLKYLSFKYLKTRGRYKLTDCQEERGYSFSFHHKPCGRNAFVHISIIGKSKLKWFCYLTKFPEQLRCRARTWTQDNMNIALIFQRIFYNSAWTYILCSNCLTEEKYPILFSVFTHYFLIYICLANSQDLWPSFASYWPSWIQMVFLWVLNKEDK